MWSNQGSYSYVSGGQEKWRHARETQGGMVAIVVVMLLLLLLLLLLVVVVVVVVAVVLFLLKHAHVHRLISYIITASLLNLHQAFPTFLLSLPILPGPVVSSMK